VYKQKERGANLGRKSQRSPIDPADIPESAIGDENREAQMIALATRRAERMLMSEDCPAQIVTQYLKLGSVKAKLENEKLQNEIMLLKKKCEALEAQKKTEELYANAIKAMQTYAIPQYPDDGDLP